MKRAVLFLPLGGLAIALILACSPDPPVVGTTGLYTPYGQTRSDASGIVAPVPGSWDPITNQPYGATGEPTAAVNPYAGASNPYGVPGVSYSQPLPYIPPAPPQVRPQPPVIRPQPVIEHRPQVNRASASSLLRQVRLEKDYLPYRARGRTRRRMKPRYITIHSTQNWSRGADARRHSLALKRSKLGRLSWHYTTDESRAVQHLPTTEQGNHADYDGPGNKYSIGIEMCENRGNSRSATMARTAKLAAWLMYKHDIPIKNVVPHYKWPRWGKRPPNKNCPPDSSLKKIRKWLVSSSRYRKGFATNVSVARTAASGMAMSCWKRTRSKKLPIFLRCHCMNSCVISPACEQIVRGFRSLIKRGLRSASCWREMLARSRK